MKNRTVIGIICIILAVVVTFAVSPLVNKISEQKEDIIRFTKDISQGTQITDADFETVKVLEANVPANALTDKAAVVGKYASTDIFVGDYATSVKLTDDANSAANVLGALSGDKVAMSITINSFAGGLSGKLENGDIVSIYVTNKDGETEIPPELKYVRVITTTTSGGVDEAEVVPNEDGSFDLPTTVTVLVSVKQASILANNEENAAMHIALVFRGEEAKAKQFLDAQDKYLKKAEEGENANG